MTLFRRNHKPQTEITTLEVGLVPVSSEEKLAPKLAPLDSEDISSITMTFDRIGEEYFWFDLKDTTTGYTEDIGFKKVDFCDLPEDLDKFISREKRLFRRKSVNLRRYGAI